MKSFSNSFLILLVFAVLIQCESPDSMKVQGKDPSSSINLPTGAEIKTEKAEGYQFKPGPVHLKVEIVNPSARNMAHVKLFETEGRDFFLIDSAGINAGIAEFNLNNVVPGMYKIGFSNDPSQLADIILNPAEPNVSMAFGSANLKSGMTGTDSKENQGLKNYALLENSHMNDLQRIRSSSSQNKTQEIYNLQAEFKKTQDRIAAEFEGSYLANFLAHMQSPARFSKNTYWSDVDFKDVTLIRSPVFPNRIEDYMRIHASAEKSASTPQLGFYNAVDQIAAAIKEDGSDEVLQFVLYTMSEGFYSSGMEDLSLYVVDNYFYGDGCGDADISELFKQKAAGIRNLQVGNVPPNFTLSSSTQKQVDFQKIAGANKYTLLLFWASFCHKCEQVIPELKSVYNTYADKGFEVVAVSVDTDRNDWLKGVQNHQTVWSNVSDLEGWRGDVARDFRVTSTPVMFLVDQNRNLVAKPTSAAQLHTFLQANLK